jgi:hypothetical protein
VISAEVVITRCRGACVDGLSSEFVRADRTLKSAKDQTLGAQSCGIARPQFLSALWAVWHLDLNCRDYFTPFASDAVTFSAAFPYSWQVSRIRTGSLIEKPERRLTRI